MSRASDRATTRRSARGLESSPLDPTSVLPLHAAPDARSAPGAPFFPERIGSYRILGELGRGAMGVVYRAEDPRLEREVALKVLPAEFSDDPRRLSRFDREAKLLAAMNHPGIATIHSLEEAGIASLLHNLGQIAHANGDYEQAISINQESLAIRREFGDRRGIAMSLHSLGIIGADQGESDRGRSLIEESLAIRRELGDRQGIAVSVQALGNDAHDRGDYDRARTLYEESLAMDRRCLAATRVP